MRDNQRKAMYAKMRYRVYDIKHTPLEGSDDFVDVRNRKMAIGITQAFNSNKPKGKSYGWSKIKPYLVKVNKTKSE